MSATYADETLTVFVDGIELASADAGEGCGSQVGPIDEGDAFHIGADGTALEATDADHTWRGRIDEVRIASGADAPGDLFCAAR